MDGGDDANRYRLSERACARFRSNLATAASSSGLICGGGGPTLTRPAGTKEIWRRRLRDSPLSERPSWTYPVQAVQPLLPLYIFSGDLPDELRGWTGWTLAGGTPISLPSFSWAPATGNLQFRYSGPSELSCPAGAISDIGFPGIFGSGPPGPSSSLSWASLSTTGVSGRFEPGFETSSWESSGGPLTSSLDMQMWLQKQNPFRGP